MTAAPAKAPFIAIACGGTGGHLFPGLAVAEQLRARGCDVALLISPKDVDQQGVKAAAERRESPRPSSPGDAPLAGMAPGAPFEIFTLPAVGLQNRNYFSFAKSFWKSFSAARNIFKQRAPVAVLAMGGFTSAPPVLAARKFGAKTFLHESNTIPGKSNRLLARLVDGAFVGFPECAARLRAPKTSVTGTPVRPQFQPRDAAACRLALGLEPDRLTILVVGGSQGAHGLNTLILSALPLLAERGRGALQWLHLTGASDFDRVKAFYATHKIKAVVKPFLAEMELALGAATACVSRSGASSLAEIAALRLPSALVPLPTSADNHQLTNAFAFEKTGAAKLLIQSSLPEKVAAVLMELVSDDEARMRIQAALAPWHAPQAAAVIAECILESVGVTIFKSPNLQAPSSREIPSSNSQGNLQARVFGAWFLGLLWSLDVGAWGFFHS